MFENNFHILALCLTAYALVRVISVESTVSLIDFQLDHVNMKMEGYGMRTVTVLGHGVCAYECLVTINCKSLNYQLATGICELNSEDSTSAPGSLTAAQGYVFTHKRAWPFSMAHACAGAACLAKEKCLPPGVCQGECDDPPEFLNSYRSFSSLTKGSKAVYTCDGGFQLVGDPVLICQQNLTWTQTDFECKQCDSPPDIANAEVSYTSLITDSQAVYTCYQGYDTVGETVITCLQDFTWSATNLECKTCPAPPTVSNAAVQSGSSLVGSVRTYTCTLPTMHIMAGSGQITCLSNAVWSVVDFECRPPGTCEELKICNSGYTTDGEYWIYPTYYPGERMAVYCFNMDSSVPLDYVTLHYENVFHYDASSANTYYEVNGCGFYDEVGDVTTFFDKIRLDPETMIVDAIDFTFTSSIKDEWDDPPMAFGTAGDCTFAFECTPRQGTLLIDTTGTGLVVNRTMQLVGTGWGGKFHDFTKSASGEIISARCGGKCGGCEPETDIRLEIYSAGAPVESYAVVHSCG